MFQCKGSSSHDIPHEIRMDDIELKEKMVVTFSPQTCKPSIRNCCSEAVSSFWNNYKRVNYVAASELVICFSYNVHQRVDLFLVFSHAYRLDQKLLDYCANERGRVLILTISAPNHFFSGQAAIYNLRYDVTVTREWRSGVTCQGQNVNIGHIFKTVMYNV